MKENYQLRLGEMTDFDQLFEIYMDERNNPFLSFEIMNKTAFKPVFLDLMGRGELYVFEQNNQIAATCIVMRHKWRANHVVSLGTLATHPKLQNKGIGSSFIRALVRDLTEAGVKRVDLCVEADNPVAIHFYKKLGFQQEGVLKKYFKRRQEDHYIDEYMMALILD